MTRDIRSNPTPIPGQTLAAAVRDLVANLSWADARRLIAGRRVSVNGSICLDDARRLIVTDRIEVLGESQTNAPLEREVRIVYSDADIVVVDKPAGLQTLRRNEERNWSNDRKQRQPVLAEIVEQILTPRRGKREGKSSARSAKPRRVRPVHRLDRDTSGLMLFALSPAAEQELVRRFAGHDIHRVYRAVVHGTIREARTVESWMSRDRGDGIRGSVTGDKPPVDAQRAVTHIRPVEVVGGNYSIIECRLETGRTHQIRIHLAEIGHMLCGEKIYLRPNPGAPAVEDLSGAIRQALHSAELKFEHPVTHKAMGFESNWPKDLSQWLDGLR